MRALVRNAARTGEPGSRSDAEPAAPPAPTTRRDVLQYLAATLVLPPLLWVLLRPDWFFIQNSLDPYFYTGYTQNLDDALAVAGDGHYFVSRWSLYLPGRVFFKLFGAVGGFVVFRWVLTAGCIALVMRLGQRRWGWPAAWLAALAVVLSPMYVRAIFSDYSDAIVLPFGMLMIALLATRPLRPLVMGAAGVAAGLAVVANAFAGSMVAISLVVALVFVRSERRWAARAIVVAAFAAGFVVVITAGLLLFRWRYGIGDVYRPTVDFVTDRFGYAGEPLKRSTLTWMGYYLWIYLPPLVVGLAGVLHATRKVRFDRAEWCILATCAVQYAFQVWYQFTQNGFTLEITYYWLYTLPSLFLAAAVVAGRCAQRAPRTHVMAIAVASIAFLALIDRGPELFPNWIVAALAVGLAITLALVAADRFPAGLAAVAFLLPIAVPLFAPRPVPLEPGDIDLQPQYDNAFHAGTSAGQLCFRAASWFVEQMDELGDPIEHDVYFWAPLEGCAQQMVATTIAHVDGHLLNRDLFGPDIPEPAWSQVGDDITVLGLLGSSEGVDQKQLEIESRGFDSDVVLDASSPYDDGTRVRIIRVH